MTKDQSAPIRRGVSLYSFQEEYGDGRLDLEGCVRTVAELGATGVEIVADQSVPGNPEPDEAFYGQWAGWMKKYGLTPVCDDIFINTSLYKNRNLTIREGVVEMKKQLKFAHRIGCDTVRLVSMTPPELIEPCLDYATELNVCMALEIHAGMGFNHPESKRFIDLMTKLDSPHVGLIVDMGIFCDKYPRIVADFYRRQGVRPELVDYLLQAYANRSLDTTHAIDPKVVEKFQPKGVEFEFIAMVGGFEFNDYGVLKQYLPYLKNFHGKFYEMVDDSTEYSIDYPKILGILKEIGYQGYICSEYEGNRFLHDAFPVDSVAQVRLHQNMMKTVLGV